MTTYDSNTCTGLSLLGLAPERTLEFQEHPALASETQLARVSIVHGQKAEVVLVHEISQHNSFTPQTVSLSPELINTPVAGDWVLILDQRIVHIAQRYTALTRPHASSGAQQALAANIDTVFLVVSLEVSPSLKAIEKLLLMGWESGAQPVLVLSKTDLCAHWQFELERIAAIALGVQIIPLSVETGQGLAEIASLARAQTSTMLGASGAGKTSLLNALNGSTETTFAVRRDGQGRHTTSTRKLHCLKGGGAILDIPGIRSLSLDVSDESLAETFADIEKLAAYCKFNDCTHSGDQGCAVSQAILQGQLAPRRLESWQAVQKELAYLARKKDRAAQSQQKQSWKKMTQEGRTRGRIKRGQYR